LKQKVLPVKKNYFDVNIFSIFVQEILKKMGHGLVGDVATNDDVPVEWVQRWRLSNEARKT